MDIHDSYVLSVRTSPSFSKSPEEDKEVELVPTYVTNTSDSTLLVLDNALEKARMLSQVMEWQVPLLDTAREEDKALSFHQFENSLLAVAVSDIKLSSFQMEMLGDLQKDMLAIDSLNTTAPQFPSFSDSELWERISNYIGKINGEYLSVYESIVSEFTKIFSLFTSDLLGKMDQWINGKDNNTVKVKVNQMVSVITALMMKARETVLFPPESSGKKAVSYEEAKKWAADLGLGCKVSEVDGGYVVTVDPQPFADMIPSFSGPNEDVEVDMAKFQAWQTKFNAQHEKLKSIMQVLTQKYSTANSIYDNLVKVLSSTVSSCLDAAKTFLQR
ncbi:type III secretion system needle tip protein SctA [Yokenella regensburgei]|uniref:type III secretion system needle tip protein SctA n=1 Tax=Yokenella regensburgei TaxID=158877 RepID=UPI001432CCB4|nr:type III secretion system needle tip protein SctA [Yokenella regensburgei]QIU92570.1 type III secretion system needle tip protein SctA [Yokenella regensburgei]